MEAHAGGEVVLRARTGVAVEGEVVAVRGRHCDLRRVVYTAGLLLLLIFYCNVLLHKARHVLGCHSVSAVAIMSGQSRTFASREHEVME